MLWVVSLRRQVGELPDKCRYRRRDGAATIAAFAEDMSEFLKNSELTQPEGFRLSASVGGR